MVREFNFIRHGEKLKVGEVRKPLEESGLTPEQQAKWKESVESLKLKDPELAYEALPKIERLAREIYDSLPEDAFLVFLSTDTPRTKLTTDLLSSELLKLEQQNKKNIAVAYLWEPNKEFDGLSNVFTSGVMTRMEKILRRDYADEKFVEEYFRSDGSKTFPKEEEIAMEAFNEDLSSEDSALKKRAELIKSQYEKIAEIYKDEKRPVFFYSLNHHSGLIALDIAFNGRKKYNSLNEMPKTLSLWKAKTSLE